MTKVQIHECPDCESRVMVEMAEFEGMPTIRCDCGEFTRMECIRRHD